MRGNYQYRHRRSPLPATASTRRRESEPTKRPGPSTRLRFPVLSPTTVMPRPVRGPQASTVSKSTPPTATSSTSSSNRRRTTAPIVTAAASRIASAFWPKWSRPCRPSGLPAASEFDSPPMAGSTTWAHTITGNSSRSSSSNSTPLGWPICMSWTVWPSGSTNSAPQ